jgi:hypothetical protein
MLHLDFLDLSAMRDFRPLSTDDLREAFGAATGIIGLNSSDPADKKAGSGARLGSGSGLIGAGHSTSEMEMTTGYVAVGESNSNKHSSSTSSFGVVLNNVIAATPSTRKAVTGTKRRAATSATNNSAGSTSDIGERSSSFDSI